MDSDSIFKQFLARDDNKELRQLCSQSMEFLNNPPSQNQFNTNLNNQDLGTMHTERQMNLNLDYGAPTSNDFMRPKHVMLDEISDALLVDGTQFNENINMQWSQLPLSPDLLKGIQNMGFAKPSKIQQCALPLILGSCTNIIAQAKNGSGKTATFALAMLSKVNVNVPLVQALCICPTRELATQNVQVIQKLGQFTQIKCFLGVPQCPRYEDNDQYHLYVGTPGKTMDFLKKRIMNVTNVVMLVLDEADELINQQNNMGPQVLQIRNFFRGPVQIVLFSATFSDNVYNFATKIAPRAHVIQVKREQLTLDCIDQRYMICNDDEDKFNKLSEIYSSMIVGQSVIFVNSRETAFKLSQRMRDQGHAVSLLCGTLGPSSGPNSMTPEIRDRIMKEFKDGETKVLICTDVLARGIDVPQVTLVINYELPMSYSGAKTAELKSVCMETYLHRIGRTGRFGVRGMAINMITVNEMALIESIKQFYKCNVDLLECDPEELENMVRNFRV
ncbi:DEAD/DEAH box helicase family protein [Theileria parva strain Muguga]|uniref:RNA helicase n=1 Tax=Theileria parva TaxID=5875 RepID=Q4N9Q9_THEPA|nr:DEAD/DEAH box helicase family protein [Theileria parva strain Muguga]EAN33299.1 DEAD/DEAH box helicase family protein [Theileria parva strain Muguga]|eukprot:XP_765582.1 DEAD box RNA helicase [Theileria parva strain Muguga]